LSGMVEPVAALLGASAVLLMESVLPYALSFAAGAMIYVVSLFHPFGREFPFFAHFYISRFSIQLSQKLAHMEMQNWHLPRQLLVSW
jgi:hypothetical protein